MLTGPEPRQRAGMIGIVYRSRTPAQRAHRLVGHGDAPVLSEAANSSSSRQDAPSRYRVAVPAARSALPRERFSPLTHLRHGPPEFSVTHNAALPTALW